MVYGTGGPRLEMAVVRQTRQNAWRWFSNLMEEFFQPCGLCRAILPLYRTAHHNPYQKDRFSDGYAREIGSMLSSLSYFP
jgi:hypothetical protein